MVTRRSTAAVSVVSPDATPRALLKQTTVQGIAAPASARSEHLTLRLSNQWLELWELLKGAHPELNDSELLRQAIALRAALAAVDSKGKRPRSFIEYHDEKGKLVTVDLEEHVGIKPNKPSKTSRPKQAT